MRDTDVTGSAPDEGTGTEHTDLAKGTTNTETSARKPDSINKKGLVDVLVEHLTHPHGTDADDTTWKSERARLAKHCLDLEQR